MLRDLPASNLSVLQEHMYAHLEMVRINTSKDDFTTILSIWISVKPKGENLFSNKTLCDHVVPVKTKI